MSDDKAKGRCTECDGEYTLTKNGRIRSHGGCPGGSGLPKGAGPEPAPKTASGGPNPHRAPLAPDAPLGDAPCGSFAALLEREVGDVGTVLNRLNERDPSYDPRCPRCDTDDHRCPGCGEPVRHDTVVCADCTVFYADDPSLEKPVNPDAAAQLQREDVVMTDPDADAADFFGPGPGSDEDAAAAFFDSDEPEQAPSKGRWITARYDGECDHCLAYFNAGDEIRGTEDGWQGRECCGQAEDDGVEQQQQTAQPRRVSPKPPMDKNRSRYRLRNPLTGKAQSYSRVTTWVKAASDHYALTAWQLRSCVVGLAKSPELLKRAEGLDVKEHAKALNVLAEDAKNAAGAKDKASIGTKVHKWTEELDAGRIGLDRVPEEFRDRCAEYLTVLRESGCTVLPHLIERTTVEPELGLVGTFDQVWACPDGVYRIVDKKTGAIKYDRLEIEAQLSIYAHGSNRYGVAEWDPALGDADDPAAWVWRPLTDNDGNRVQVSETSAIVVHMPQDGAPIQLLEVDLERGWEHAQLCRQVKASQKLNPEFPLLEFDAAAARGESAAPAPTAGADLLARVVPQQRQQAEPVAADFQAPEQPAAEPAKKPLTWAERFSAVRTKDEAKALLAQARDAGMPKERQDALIAMAKQALAA